MPLRDHFQPPIAPDWQWHSTLAMLAFHTIIRLQDVVKIPQHFRPDLDVKRGEFVESNYVPEGFEWLVSWQPEEPHAAFDVALPAQDRVELRYRDDSRQGTPAAAIEFVAEGNKRDAAGRRSFAVKCADRLRQAYSVVVIDLITVPNDDLLTLTADLLDVRLSDRVRGGSPSAYSMRSVRQSGWRLEIWQEPCTVGQPLPTLPLWLADDIAVPLDLEPIYEATCRSLRIT